MNKMLAIMSMGKDYFKNEQEIEEFIKDNELLMNEFDEIISKYKSKYKTNNVVVQIIRDVRYILGAKEGENIRNIAQLRMTELESLRRFDET